MALRWLREQNLPRPSLTDTQALHRLTAGNKKLSVELKDATHTRACRVPPPNGHLHRPTAPATPADPTSSIQRKAHVMLLSSSAGFENEPFLLSGNTGSRVMKPKGHWKGLLSGGTSAARHTREVIIRHYPITKHQNPKPIELELQQKHTLTLYFSIWRESDRMKDSPPSHSRDKGVHRLRSKRGEAQQEERWGQTMYLPCTGSVPRAQLWKNVDRLSNLIVDIRITSYDMLLNHVLGTSSGHHRHHQQRPGSTASGRWSGAQDFHWSALLPPSVFWSGLERMLCPSLNMRSPPREHRRVFLGDRDESRDIKAGTWTRVSRDADLVLSSRKESLPPHNDLQHLHLLPLLSSAPKPAGSQCQTSFQLTAEAEAMCSPEQSLKQLLDAEESAEESLMDQKDARAEQLWHSDARNSALAGKDEAFERILGDLLSTSKRSWSRFKKGGLRSCFGVRLERIGSFSGLGC
ncbi:hypothetical protein DNTS_015401 [Danionella cerebrum]|uniref:Uncharacterized protein n=1 Tax=Danionella cerebrum TaxID=2873325 RepID=A0A553R3R5_9TELE|nr:hypothetical protein DNTS_015401 [Danionella translucida]